MDIIATIFFTSAFWLLAFAYWRAKSVDGILQKSVNGDTLLYSIVLFDDPEGIQYKNRLVFKVE